MPDAASPEEQRKGMERPRSRRSALKIGAIALGTIAAGDLNNAGLAAQWPGISDAKESPMPHVIIKMFPGRTEQQKRQMTDAIVKDVITFSGAGESSISVAIEEISPAEWTDKVYKPDIQGKWDTLYKKPGY